MLHRSPAFSFGFLVGLWLCAGYFQSARLWADDASPASPLLNLVGADAGLCVELSGLGREFPRITHSELFGRLERLPVYTAWKQSAEFRKLHNIRQFIEHQTGQPLKQFAFNLLGESVVFAVYPREAGEPAGVLLLKAADSAALSQALNAWNRQGRVHVETIDFANGQYRKRIESKGPKSAAHPQYYFIKDEVFAISDDEDAIRTLVARSQGQSPQETLPDSAKYQTARKSLPADCLLTVYFNPRVWRTGWELAEGKSRAEIFVANLWKRCHSLAAGLRADRGLTLDVVVHFDPDNLPERWQRLVARTEGFPEFLAHVSARALLVFAGKQDLSGIDKLLTAEMSESVRQQWQHTRQIGRGLLLGLDLFEDVLPKFRPNWGVVVLPRQELDPQALPVEGLLAIELPPGSEEDNPASVRKALENALSTGFNLLAVMENSKKTEQLATVKTQADKSGSVHWVESVGPYRPAYCLSDEYLILASSPEAITEFLSPETPKLVSSPLFQAWSNGQTKPSGQVLFVSWQTVRQFIAENRKFLLDQAVETHSLPREEAETRLQRLTDVLQVLDAVYLGVRIQEREIHLTAGGITLK